VAEHALWGTRPGGGRSDLKAVIRCASRCARTDMAWIVRELVVFVSRAVGAKQLPRRAPEAQRQLAGRARVSGRMQHPAAGASRCALTIGKIAVEGEQQLVEASIGNPTLPTNHRWPTAQAARPLQFYLRARDGRTRSTEQHHQRRHDSPATRSIEERGLFEFRRARDFDKYRGGTATGSEDHRRNVLTVFASAAMMAPRGGCSAA
jgi:hypothetical protein